MPRFAANVGWIAQEVPMLKRFQLVRDLGFKAVECPIVVYDLPVADQAAACRAAGLEYLMINSPAGNIENDYGVGGLAGREQEFQDTIGKAIDYGKALGCTYIHVLAGWLPEGEDRDAAAATFVDNLKWACPLLDKAGLTALIEPINTAAWPGYLVTTTAQGQDIVDGVKANGGPNNIGIQYDFFNAQMMEGDLARTFEKHLDDILHVQIAGNPGRTPPDEGEINYPFIFELVDRLGFKGWLGCEYSPHDKEQPGATKVSLKWANSYGLG